MLRQTRFLRVTWRPSARAHTISSYYCRSKQISHSHGWVGNKASGKKDDNLLSLNPNGFYSLYHFSDSSTFFFFIIYLSIYFCVNSAKILLTSLMVLSSVEICCHMLPAASIWDIRSAGLKEPRYYQTFNKTDTTNYWQIVLFSRQHSLAVLMSSGVTPPSSQPADYCLSDTIKCSTLPLKTHWNPGPCVPLNCCYMLSTLGIVV